MAGVSDLFLVNTQSPLAQLYNNISVNENHHCACVWKMLSQPELNITENLASEQWRELRGLVVKMFMGAIMTGFSVLSLPLALGCLPGPWESINDRMGTPCRHGYVKAF
jgi:hypothetical protein|eukprot:COSAG02_NODE_187_length_30377_cov_3.636271_31_plen_109_part_00